MKQFIIGYLTSMINDLNSVLKERPEHRSYEVKEHKEKLEGLLSAVEDMKEPNPKIIIIHEDIPSEKLMDELSYLVKKLVSEEEK